MNIFREKEIVYNIKLLTETLYLNLYISIFVYYEKASDSLSLITLTIAVELFKFPILNVSFYLNFLF